MKRCVRLAMRGLIVAFMCTAASVSDARDQSVLEYGEQCAKEIGAIPAFNCNDGTDIPITVDGKPPAPGESPAQCDKPSLLPASTAEGPCMQYSKILNLTRGNVQISAYCRRNVARSRTDPRYDEIIVVLHHAGNGKTCWFDTKPPSNSANGFDASRVPPPNEKTPPKGRPSAVEFWATPAQIANAKITCIQCHDAGPFIFSPYICQVWDKVPTDPMGKYSSIGAAFSSFHLMTMSTPGNTCTGCHRIGTEQSCQVYLGLSTGGKAPGNNALANRYPLNHWMPTDNPQSEAQWNEANVKSVDDLLKCCNDKDHTNPNCTFTPMP